ncbi:GNAT family N-acetyltransferase [Rhodobacter ferrooxidans]|uniref:GCN5-related N-acetyltransferase n=1 Tax=Rhodobacter ferrooxidans TaxID=371731 RepID=C8S2F2_9RHOB|nr:GNAT family N-acetyltransferase [Rhodobacter sp. SW2]EEW24823.1 GCN5-related N-acetyltransferase [Rhodobacter sp. SW2]
MNVQIQHGLPLHLRKDAAVIYWQAFGEKLGRVMGPPPRALAFLDRVIRADHCIAALDAKGTLLGIAGFKTPYGAFADGDPQDLRAVYGRFGAGWRGGVLRLLQSEVDNLRFLVDGICVAPEARGHGIGTLLIDALCDEGRSRGYGAIRLDVIDSNQRARALYERLGFEATGTATIGPLRHVFGFAAATTMVKALD